MEVRLDVGRSRRGGVLGDLEQGSRGVSPWENGRRTPEATALGGFAVTRVERWGGGWASGEIAAHWCAVSVESSRAVWSPEEETLGLAITPLTCLEHCHAEED